MKRLVYVIGQLGIGGTEKQLLELVARLNRSRWKPSVVCFSAEPAVMGDFERLDCPVAVILRQSLGRVRALTSLWRYLRATAPDIVQPFGYANYFAIPAARAANVPRLIVGERTVPRWKTHWHTIGDRLLLRKADRAIVNSRRVLENMVRTNGVPRERCRLVYNGLDIDKFDSAIAMNSIPEKSDLPSDGPVICAVANPREDKGLGTLIHAFASVLAAIPAARLWIVGDGQLRSQLENLAEEFGVRNQVHFWGFRADVPSILRLATVGVNSSLTEGLCNAIMEYMAARLPVVATAVGGNTELVISGETGSLVAPNDPQALAAELLRVLSDPELGRRYGEAGRKRIEQCFSVQEMVRQTEAVYEELCEAT
jgi:L-malate glycosyltransferase